MKLKDLKRGMRCTFRNGTNKIIDTVRIEPSRVDCLPDKQGCKATYFSFNEDLISNINLGLDIMKVEDITENGYETIWEREEERYYLRIPNSQSSDYTIYLNYNIRGGTYFISNNEEMLEEGFKTQFTEEEIEYLPKQDFIQSLEKEKVE